MEPLNPWQLLGFLLDPPSGCGSQESHIMPSEDELHFLPEYIRIRWVPISKYDESKNSY